MRKKAALHLDGRYITMIENAYYYSNPPDTPQLVRKERPPLHEYMRKLLYKELSKTTTEKVSSSLCNISLIKIPFTSVVLLLVYLVYITGCSFCGTLSIGIQWYLKQDLTKY